MKKSIQFVDRLSPAAAHAPLLRAGDQNAPAVLHADAVMAKIYQHFCRARVKTGAA